MFHQNINLFYLLVIVHVLSFCQFCTKYYDVPCTNHGGRTFIQIISCPNLITIGFLQSNQKNWFNYESMSPLATVCPWMYVITFYSTLHEAAGEQKVHRAKIVHNKLLGAFHHPPTINFFLSVKIFIVFFGPTLFLIVSLPKQFSALLLTIKNYEGVHFNGVAGGRGLSNFEGGVLLAFWRLGQCLE